MMHSDEVDLLELKVATCRDIIAHLAAWFDGATLDPIMLKGMVGVLQTDSWCKASSPHGQTPHQNETCPPVDTDRVTALLNDAYVFLGMPHKALHPWSIALSEWKAKVEKETGWNHFAEAAKFQHNDKGDSQSPAKNL